MKRQCSVRRQADAEIHLECNSDGIPSIIRALMGSDATIYSLFDFVKEFSPYLPVDEPQGDSHDHIRLRNTLVCPVYPLKPSGCRKVSCTESLSSLVDDVIWSLVQRRSRDKTRRNVLSQGYVLASEHLSQTHDIRPCREMRPGVLCMHMNDNVSFCKTSSYALTLHRLVGDDVMRTLLLHTYMFLPVEHDWSHRKQNYLLLCGPPLQAKRMSLQGRNTFKRALTEQSGQRRRKRRRRSLQSIDTGRKQLKANDIVPRSSLFYSGAFVPKVGLPSTHILNQRPEKCQLLLLALLGTEKKGRKRWRRIRESGIPLCEQIFRGHAKCDYHRLLNRYCPLPEFCRESDAASASARLPNSTNDSSSITLPRVSVAHSPSDGVVSFLQAVLRQVFPPEFWGSEQNFERVLDVTETFVNLRRQEQLPVKALMHGIRVKDILWIYGGAANSNASAKKGSLPKSLHEAATARMRNVMKWLFVQYIIPLLRSVFYVTESEFLAKRVLYYRKPVWSIFRSLSMKKLLVRQYKEISSSEAASRLLEQKMGFSKLRLLPKSTGVRALALLSKREFTDVEKNGSAFDSQVGSGTEKDPYLPPPAKKAKLSTNGLLRPSRMNEKFFSTNAILRNVFEILRYERERHPELFGSGVFGLSEVYPEYRRFLEAFKASDVSLGGSEVNQLYFASVDIKQCYDSIEQKHLLDILPKLLGEEEYLIQNSAVIYPFESMGRVLRKPVKRIGAPEEYCSFHDAVEGLSRKYNRSVFLDNGGSSLVYRDVIMNLLQEHLLQHIVVIQGRYGDRYLLQNTGIPQGSILSTLLCNYYYGDVEKALLGSVVEKKTANISCVRVLSDDDGHVTLLVRIVDDFLLITTNKALSTEFLTIMNAGCDDLGVRINKEKTLVNYSVLLESSSGMTESLRRCDADASSEERSVFPWCGMLFDMENGEVGVDYSRFANGKATDALTVDRCGTEGRHLEIRMKSFVRPRCQPMLFDRRINSARTVGINFCQAILLCAVKTLSYIGGMEGGVQRNADFIVRNIDDVISYTHKLITDRLRHEKITDSQTLSAQDSLLQLTSKDAMWLGRKAFLSIFCDVRGCEDAVALLATRCSSSGRHPIHDVAEEAIRLFKSQVTVSAGDI